MKDFKLKRKREEEKRVGAGSSLNTKGVLGYVP
jgi:hypothetical protein